MFFGQLGDNIVLVYNGRRKEAQDPDQRGQEVNFMWYCDIHVFWWFFVCGAILTCSFLIELCWHYRTTKDVLYYSGDVKKQADKIQEMKDKNEDEYTIKKQTEVLQEDEAALADSRRRLQTSVESLQKVVVRAKTLTSYSPNVTFNKHVV